MARFQLANRVLVSWTRRSEIISDESQFLSLGLAPNPSVYSDVLEFLSLNIAHTKHRPVLFSFLTLSQWLRKDKYVKPLAGRALRVP